MERNGVKVSITWRYDKFIDRLDQVYKLRFHQDIDDHRHKSHIETASPIRIIFPQEFLLLLKKMRSFELVGW